MRSSSVLGLSLLSLALPLAALADTHALRSRNHHQLAKRASGDVLEKRFGNARFTFYDVGLGACGKNNVPSDFIVALNSPQFESFGSSYPNPVCFRQISITYGGKTTTATIMDECPGCPEPGLDMSRGLFDFFAPEDLGVIYGSWEFTDGSGGSGGGGGGNKKPTSTPPPAPPKTSKTPEAPKTTSTPPPPPPPPPPSTHKTSTTTSHTPTTSSTSTTPTTTSHSSTTTSHTSSSSTTSSAAPSTTSAAPTSTPPNVNSGPAAGYANVLGVYSAPAGQPQNLNNANQALIGISGLIHAGAHA